MVVVFCEQMVLFAGVVRRVLCRGLCWSPQIFLLKWRFCTSCFLGTFFVRKPKSKKFIIISTFGSLSPILYVKLGKIEIFDRRPSSARDRFCF